MVLFGVDDIEEVTDKSVKVRYKGKPWEISLGRNITKEEIEDALMDGKKIIAEKRDGWRKWYITGIQGQKSENKERKRYNVEDRRTEEPRSYTYTKSGPQTGKDRVEDKSYEVNEINVNGIILKGRFIILGYDDYRRWEKTLEDLRREIMEIKSFIAEIDRLAREGGTNENVA